MLAVKTDTYIHTLNMTFITNDGETESMLLYH